MGHKAPTLTLVGKGPDDSESEENANEYLSIQRRVRGESTVSIRIIPPIRCHLAITYTFSQKVAPQNSVIG
jgi:hypothetical protein